MSILNDSEIRELSSSVGMITPFVSRCESGVISYGLSSFGYDIRAGYQWKLFTNVNTTLVDPKSMDRKCFVDIEINPFHNLVDVIIPPNSYALTSSIERFVMPPDVMAICVGKSTYARSGISINCTPLEPGWCGYLTIEVANNSPCPVRVYPNEGIAQLLFFKGMAPDVTYASRSGKYQNQPDCPVISRMKKP